MHEVIRTPPSPKIIRRLCAVIGVFVFLICSSLYLLDPSLLRAIEGRLLDSRFQLRGGTPVTDSVAIVTIDDSSLTREGRWPWSRSKLAELVKAINRLGPVAIGLDMVFSENQADQTLAEITQYPSMPEHMKHQLRLILDNHSPDTELANTLREAGNVVSAYYFYTDPRSDVPASGLSGDSLRMLQRSAVDAVKTKQGVVTIGEALGVTANIAQIAAASQGQGFFNIDPGSDGLVRKISLLYRYQGEVYPALALRLLSVAMGSVPIVVHAQAFGIEKITVGDHEVKTDEFGRMVINFRGSERTIPTYSAADILQGNISPSALQDKIVYLGVSAVGVADVRSTSFGAVFPAVEIQANVLENLLAQDTLNINNLANFTDVLTMLCIIALYSILLPRLKGVKTRALFALAVLVVYTGINYYLFSVKLVWVNMLYPLIAGLLSAGLLSVYLGVVVERTVSTVRAAFKSYLHPGLVDKLTQQPDRLRFGGEQKELTILFSDIRNFTSLSENLEPQQLSRFLRCYMDPMTEQVFQSRGTLDKYIGDAVMAFFGAPYESELHPVNACECALGMINRLKDVQACCPDLTHAFPLYIGIGIHTGETVVGNFGSSQRFNYTVLGDNVNLASRLEGMSKNYGVDIVVSESTYHVAKHQFIFRELDKVRVKGKESPVTLYELRGRTGTVQDKAYMDRWTQALMAYRQQQWQAALESFELLLVENSADKASELYIKRIKEFIVSPPAQSWDGVYRYTVK
jgi:adenylate cyclase